MRLKYVAANTFGLYWSPDGIGWYPVQTNYSRTLTPSYAAIVMVQYSETGVTYQSAGWYYIGENAPA